jgi:hypothetical protein
MKPARASDSMLTGFSPYVYDNGDIEDGEGVEGIRRATVFVPWSWFARRVSRLWDRRLTSGLSTTLTLPGKRTTDHLGGFPKHRVVVTPGWPYFRRDGGPRLLWQG